MNKSLNKKKNGNVFVLSYTGTIGRHSTENLISGTILIKNTLVQVH